MSPIYGGPVDKFEILPAYYPGFKSTGDKEAATNTINAVAEASGVGNANYFHALTMAIPADTRLSILEMVARISGTIDSLNAGCAHVYCRAYIDAQDANHRLFDLDWTTAATQLAVSNLNATTKAVIFALLKNGAAHTIYFFLWVDAGNAVLSEIQALWAIGSSGSDLNYPGKPFLAIAQHGWVRYCFKFLRIGTGTFTAALYSTLTPTDTHQTLQSTAGQADNNTASLNWGNPLFCQSVIAYGVMTPTVATDAIIMYACDICLGSQQ